VSTAHIHFILNFNVKTAVLLLIEISCFKDVYVNNEGWQLHTVNNYKLHHHPVTFLKIPEGKEILV
jgi:hypothetical protein